ncbi:hypothetical protein FJQ54_03940 [Sandaracinobacter neustonicus]|uniref:Phage shock protein B n=1 Tax=Sandaracinobacter neustonicus TaxID=1715348 RepID=A0A501XU27_9SPHN|nr:hypothetical protein [Sandaracinobacter neustonicus]TPE63995.1 hypothetical protein FJQ54_03940 [Sandaracinobacter neustonicus]
MFNTPFIVPVIALMIPIIAIVMKNWRHVQDRKMDLMEKSSTELTNVAQARIEKLEARIAVLERIVTDKRTALADEIDSLGISRIGSATPPRIDQ